MYKKHLKGKERQLIYFVERYRITWNDEKIHKKIKATIQ